jgi:hypothetical protein
MLPCEGEFDVAPHNSGYKGQPAASLAQLSRLLTVDPLSRITQLLAAENTIIGTEVNSIIKYRGYVNNVSVFCAWHTHRHAELL